MSELSCAARLPELITIRVVSMHRGTLWQRQLVLSVGTTAAQALDKSGYLLDYPSVSFADIVMGVYGKQVVGTYRLVEHDRLEIYGALIVDPKVARRRRAAHRDKNKNTKKKILTNDLTQSGTPLDTYGHRTK